MQCKNGGFASFDKNNDRMVFQHIPFADHNAMLDPPTVDITGRILEMFATYGYDKNHRAVKRALKFIRDEQEPDGSWFGRWGVNYIYGTSGVLRAAEVLNIAGSEFCQRAAAWLRRVQNQDGGFGETCATYVDPDQMGKGPSTPSQTAWALIGLLASGSPLDATVHRAVRYLLDDQNRVGSWDEQATTGTGFPRVFYLKYHLYRHSFPLYALACYRQLMRRREGAGVQQAAMSALV
jgi:squalene-hopene/tetraprenyl-beta-curcumene cyclase